MKKFILSLVLLTLSLPALADDVKESAFDRILRTGVIRCGYNQYDPYFVKDSNTGAFSGIFYDLVEELGKNTNLKIVWLEEVGYDGIFTGLDSGRYDVLCSGIWPSSSRARVGSFSLPVFYSTISAWGRIGENRFQKLDQFNSKDVRIATIDGAQEDLIAKTDFPIAQRVSSPASTPFTENFMKITSKKADITFAEPSGAYAYIAANPNTLVQLADNLPLRVFGNTLAVPKGDTKLKELLDQGLLELLNSGRIESILKKYEKYHGSFLRVAKPYEVK